MVYEKRFECVSETILNYYFAGSQRIALRENNELTFLLADHLGSTVWTVNSSGNLGSQTRYTAFGETRGAATTSTDYLYTGQRQEGEIGLYFYNARWYDPQLGRFAQGDTIIPEEGDPLAWDRYAYVMNNPLIYIDPDGHRIIDPDGYDGSHAGLLDRRIDNSLVLQTQSQQYRARIVMEKIKDTGLTWMGLNNIQKEILEEANYNEYIFNDERSLAFSKAPPQLDPLVWLVSIVTFGRINYKVIPLVAEYFCLDGFCGNEFEVSNHALMRMEKRNVSIDQLQEVLQNKPFQYIHDGIGKLGYYDPIKRIFVAVLEGNNKILTVITNIQPQYIENLKR